MKSYHNSSCSTSADVQSPRLLVTAREAAKALSISQRLLWSMTQRGDLPAVRFNRAVRYDLADLQSFVNARKGVGRE